MYDVFAQYATDPKLELEGVWNDIGPAQRTLPNGAPDPASIPRVKVARSGNKRHGRIVSQLYEANKSTLELKNDAADAKGEEITVESMAKAILLDWENLAFQKVALPDGWDYDNAKKMLAVKDFRELINRFSVDFTKYKMFQEAADAKNS